jgi:hypothetical protein
MCAKQKRGSVPDVVLAPALLLGPSLLTARRRHGIQFYGTPFQQFLRCPKEVDVDLSELVAHGAPT